MKITIEAVGMELSESMRTYVASKFKPLEKFLKRFEGAGEMTVSVEVVRTTRHHRKGDVFEVVAGVRLPKKSVRVAESADDVRTATDRAKDVLRAEIEKYKEKTILSSKRTTAK